MFLLYNLLLTLLAPFWAPWMLWRAHKRVERPNWRERQGDYRESIPKKGDRSRLWVHAVSVGEVVAAQPLLKALRKELPEHEIVLSVTTSSGHRSAREAKERFYDHLVYLPIDVARFTLNAMLRVRPDALIVMETELWFNLFWAAKTLDVKTFVVNARLSDRAYPRSRRFRFFYRPLLEMVEGVLAQTEGDAERFRSLGARRVAVVGNIKFDQALDEHNDATDWRKELGLDERPVVVVGSLRAEEFGDFSGLLALDSRVQWIVAPRHIERTAELVRAIESTPDENDPTLAAKVGVGYRSKGTHGDVTILDTYGELARVYRIADVAIVGGSFRKVGMQNPIQPMAWGKPVLHGPFTQNFRDVANLAQKAGASIVCRDVDDLRAQLDVLMHDPLRRVQMGEAAKRLVETNRGASERMARVIASTLKT